MTIFPQFERELRELARRRVGARDDGRRASARPGSGWPRRGALSARHRAGFRWGWSRRLPGAMATALGAVVAIAVAALAAVLVGHSRPRAQPAAAGRVPAAARGLVSMLAVLRRPQTEADRTLPTSVLASQTGGGWAVVPSLTRLVATVPSASERLTGRALPKVRLYLIVTTPKPARGTGGRPAPSPGALVSMAWVSRQGPAVGFGVSPGIPAGRLNGASTLRLAAGYNLEIVPDGVTRVRWRFFEGTVYPTVQQNVALAPSTRLKNVRGGGQLGTVFERKYLEGVTWYGPQGQVLKSFHDAAANPLASGKLVSQLNLQPPTSPSTKATGIVDVYKSGNSHKIKVMAAGLAANTHRNAYAIWLYTSPSHSKLLGFVSPGVRTNGRLSSGGTLPPNAQNYTHILITLEDQPNPKAPGKIVLEGKLRFG